MFFISVKLNKIAFVIITLSEMVSLYVAYYLKLNIYMIAGFGAALLILKYFLFMICYKVLNVRNVWFSILSILISMTIELLVCFKSVNILLNNFLIFKHIPEFVVASMFPITFIVKLMLFISLLFMRRFVKYGVDIPVSVLERNYRDKIDEWAEMIPGL